jgi:hypothetical protein
MGKCEEVRVNVWSSTAGGANALARWNEGEIERVGSEDAAPSELGRLLVFCSTEMPRLRRFEGRKMVDLLPAP